MVDIKRWGEIPETIRKRIMVGVIIFAIMLEFFGFYWFFLNDIIITKTKIDNGKLHYELLDITYSTPFNLPLKPETQKVYDELCAWNRELQNEIENEYIWLDIRVHNKLESKGRLILWYEGIGTTKENESVDFFREKQLECGYVTLKFNDDYEYEPGDIRRDLYGDN